MHSFGGIMSGLEVVGTVAGLIKTLYSISKDLYQISNALSSASSDINDLARDLETFAEELQLLYTLLDKEKLYADQIHRITAKIIGDCATICIKVDRILGKMRNGKFLAKVRWIYKEKEIRKLLARLRDLKLSLMSMLSFMNVLKADLMIDSLGLFGHSLLERSSNQPLSKATIDQVTKTEHTIEALSKLISVQSLDPFHGAISNPDSSGQDTEKSSKGQSMVQSTVPSNKTLPDRSVSWNSDMVTSAIKYFDMSKEDAEGWASSLPLPGKSNISSATPTKLNLPPTIQWDSNESSSFDDPATPEELRVYETVSFQQAKQLWWRAYIKLRQRHEPVAQGIISHWVDARRKCSPLGVDDLIEVQAAHEEDGMLDSLCRDRLHQDPKWNLLVPDWKKTIGLRAYIADVVHVMRDTLGFKVGGFVWIYFCNVAIYFGFSLSGLATTKMYRPKAAPNTPCTDDLGAFCTGALDTITALSNIATLIARYNVLEVMYRSFPGMTLENTYEDCLLETCVLIFECLDKISQYRDDDLNTVQDVKDWAKKIAAADQKCRGFIAIFEEVPIIKEGTERQFENLEDETDSDDSSRQTEKLDNEEITQGTSAPGAKESKV